MSTQSANPASAASPHPYIPNTGADRAKMLDAIGVSGFDELVADIPASHVYPDLRLPEGTPEQTLAAELAGMAASNATPGDYACFLGAGAYRHFVPAVTRSIASRGEFVTAYTPYQPEAAQGTLQVGFEFQTAVCQLTGMEVANAGMYDGATAFAEAALMACRVTRRNSIAVLETTDERLVEVLHAYSRYQGLEVNVVDSVSSLPDGAACLMAQSPNVYGVIEDHRGAWSKPPMPAARWRWCTPIRSSLGMFKPPGEYGADITTAEGQPLGVPLSFGGSYVGLLACRQAHVRQMPGRIVGRTTDNMGRRGFALTLQTREQHIRRERATSNICTSTQLIALMATSYVAAMGKSGMRQVAELCYQKAHYAASSDRQSARLLVAGRG